MYGSLREYIHLFKATNIKWSAEFQLDQLPENFNTTKPDEALIDKHINESGILLDKGDTQNKDIVISSELEDLGVSIERDTSLEDGPIHRQKKLKHKFTLKWRNALIKNLKKSISLTYKNNKFEKSLLKKLKRKTVKFLDNSSLKNGDKYLDFLRALVNDKKALKRDDLMNESFDINSKNKILNKLKIVFKDYISK